MSILVTLAIVVVAVLVLLWLVGLLDLGGKDGEGARRILRIIVVAGALVYVVALLLGATPPLIYVGR